MLHGNLRTFTKLCSVIILENVKKKRITKKRRSINSFTWKYNADYDHALQLGVLAIMNGVVQN